MDKKEFVQSFLDKLLKQDYENIYKFFTRESVVFYIRENKTTTVPLFLEDQSILLKDKEYKIVREFDSPVCIKYEVQIGTDLCQYYFEVSNRRISRVEFTY